MSSKYELEKLFRVYEVKAMGCPCIEVRPHADRPGEFIEICTNGEENVEYYGELNLTLSNEQAVLLAKAILELAS